jgi:hypothetical protein
MSSARTVACARRVVETTVDTYFAPNKTIRELRELINSGVGIDPQFGIWHPGTRLFSRLAWPPLTSWDSQLKWRNKVRSPLALSASPEN